MTTESTCSETLRQQGKPYPRTCRKCGLGPCVGKPVTTPPASQEQAQQPSMAPSIHEDNYRVVAGVLTDLRNILGLADGDSLIDAVMALKQQPSGGEVWIQPNHLQKARVAPFLCRVAPTRLAPDFVPLFTHPAPGVPEGWAMLKKVSESAVYVGGGECSLSMSLVREIDAFLAAAQAKGGE